MTPKNLSPTPHDLVVLAVLTEEPMHGYRLNQVLVERDVQDWAAMSKPQVYYSLKKLRQAGLIKPMKDAGESGGPDREVLTLTPAGRRALERGLDNEQWATQRPPPPFLTWLALSPHLTGIARRAIIKRRRQFLTQELGRERVTLSEFANDRSPMATPGRLMVTLTVQQFELELAWLDDVEHELGKN